MLRNYFKIALRNILKQKGYSFINITGLAVGLASCLLIALWIMNELSYDRFHKDHHTIYHVLAQGTTVKNNPCTPAPLGPALREEIPEIVEATRYDGMLEVLMTYKDKRFNEGNIRAVDPSFFKMFTFPLVKGNPDTALNNVNSIVISKAIAEKYFGSEEPVGKVLTMNHKRALTVTGVLEDMPANSTLRFEILVPYEIRVLSMRERGWEMNWGAYTPQTLIKLRDDASAGKVGGKIALFVQEHVKGEDAVLTLLPFIERNLFFSNKERYIYIFSAIALFILMIACINFMNLSTARSGNRAKEIGIRKVSGAYRRDIVIQFLGESLILSFLALILAFLLVAFVIPYFNAIIGISLSTDMLHNPIIVLVLTGLVLVTGIAAGSYPALFLSAFQPVKVLQKEKKFAAKGSLFRKTLVVIQFSLSIFLIIGTALVYKQLQYMKNRDLGYHKEHILNITLNGDSRKFYPVLKNKLLQDERILNVTGTLDDLPYFGWSSGTADWDGKDPTKELLTFNNIIDYDFVETLKIEIVAGRSFSKEFSSDTGMAFIINEEMVKAMGLKSADAAVGARLDYWRKPGKIVGVMKNFNFQPLTTQINPLVLILDPGRVAVMSIRIPPGNITSSLGFIKKTWESLISSYPFAYSFLDEAFDRRYRGIERIGNLLNMFAVLAVMIACLGLFGLASFTAEQRSKEIGIRKVFGAPVSGVVLLLSKEFTRCVLIANLIAWPAAYFAISSWLQNFAYKTPIGIGIFILSGLTAFIIALLTVSYRSVRAARANPAETLRYE